MVSKKRLIFLTVFWFLGTFLLLAAATDLFSHFLTKDYMVFYFLILINTFLTARLWAKYREQQREKAK